MSARTLLSLASCLVLSLILLGLACWIPEEGKRRARLFQEDEEARAFLSRHAREIEEARWRLSRWQQGTAGSAENRLVDAVSRFQRHRDDFRLVGLMPAPEGILMEAECRSQAAVEFLLFTDRELPDLTPSRIFLSRPPETRVGSLRAEISFRRLRPPEIHPAGPASPDPETFPPPPLDPRAAELRIRP
ncbi:conserved protein of unknown function [Methylacidimicrobium sp. AP8]|uniref:hypothetical protein n=1 Tax=Methylacidimicrobium sp. AP8 TaxID=2730359 RepID=UPI0018C105DD|nr:hypothetical protein [Methylacidimicrobium sp. AP8]CAB4243593.1 conserved protein of unknown function [Methylacidimicrobium sp. AP8]